jgi:hypothetical protein
VLEPNPAADSHPYPIELDLPLWTLACDVDLRTWLFAFGAGIRIEQPEAMRQELMQRCRDSLAVHGAEVADSRRASSQEEGEPGPTRERSAPGIEDTTPRRFPNRWRRD